MPWPVIAPDEVEEAVEQVAAEDVAGHVLRRRHPLQRRVREELAGEQRVRELEPEAVGELGVDLEGVPEAELPVLEPGLLGEVLVEQLAHGDGVRGLDGIRGREVVVLAGVDDDPGAGVHLAAEALVDEGADRVDVAEEDAVHRVVEHHVEPLEAGEGRDLGHAQAARVVREPHVAPELLARLVEGRPHEAEVLLRGVGAGVPLAGRALGHEVEQALPGGADDGDDVGALARGVLGLRDVLVDVAGGDDEVDPGLLRRVAVPAHEPVARRALAVDGADAARHGRARGLAGRAVASLPSGRRKDTEPLAAFWARVSRSGASPRRRASQTGVVTPCSRPTSARTASTRWLTHGTFSWSAPESPARRSVARSTETVVWLRARSTTGLPARRARVRARRTVAGSRSRIGRGREDTASIYQQRREHLRRHGAQATGSVERLTLRGRRFSDPPGAGRRRRAG